MSGSQLDPAFAGLERLWTYQSTPAKAGAQWGAAAMREQACVYIMASKRNGTIYIGSATDLAKRIWEHRNLA